MTTLLKAQTSPRSSLAMKMTLRDCTLFLQIPKELITETAVCESPTTELCPDETSSRSDTSTVNGTGARPIRIIIADLDEKSEAHRGEYWKSLEESLIKGGYYLGEGKLDHAAEDCDLRDIVRTSDQINWNRTE